MNAPDRGEQSAAGVRVALVVSRFNELICERLLDGAERCLDHHGGRADERQVVRVPGAWELPQAAAWLAKQGRHDVIVALGALIRGETPHFDVLAHAVAAGLSNVALRSGVPVIFGVLTTENADQAVARSREDETNKGWEAALAALEMVELGRSLKRPGSGR